MVEEAGRGDLHRALGPLRGGTAGRALDWWDRSVAADAFFSEGTFSQQFVRAKGRNVEDRIDPDVDYWALCWTQV